MRTYSISIWVVDKHDPTVGLLQLLHRHGVPGERGRKKREGGRKERRRSARATWSEREPLQSDAIRGGLSIGKLDSRGEVLERKMQSGGKEEGEEEEEAKKR